MRFLARIVCCSFLVVGSVGILGSSPARGQFFAFENPLVGEKAPDFSLKTMNGREINLTKFRGNQNTIIFFWATWCPHCREQLQQLIGGQGEEIRKKGIKILLIDAGETAAEVRSYIQHYKIGFELVLDEDSAVSEQYHLVGVPTFLFIDKTGIVRAVEYTVPENYEEMFASPNEDGKGS